MVYAQSSKLFGRWLCRGIRYGEFYRDVRRDARSLDYSSYRVEVLCLKLAGKEGLGRQIGSYCTTGSYTGTTRAN